MESLAFNRRRLLFGAGAIGGAALLTACTSNEPEAAESSSAANVSTGGDNDQPGTEVTIGFSAPAADHGWIAAITTNAKAQAEQFEDVTLNAVEGSNDVNQQISQVETFINDGVDAIVLLPFDGAAMTPVALKAMEAGIPVINVDREFDDPNAARVTVLGDNYGMGVSAGTYVCSQLADTPGAVVAEIAGIDSLPLTQDRSQGFEDALAECGLDVDNRVAAEFPGRGGRDWLSYDNANEIKQTSRGALDLPAFSQAFLWQMCAPPMMQVLREITEADSVPFRKR